MKPLNYIAVALLLLLLGGCSEEKAVPLTDEAVEKPVKEYEKGHIETH